MVEFEKSVDLFLIVDMEDYLSGKLGIKVETVTPDAIKERVRSSIMRDVVYV